MLVRILLPTPRLLSVRLDSDLATRLSQELACLRGPPASILWNRACPPKSLSPSGLGERWGVSKWGWVALALELKVGVAFGEGLGLPFLFLLSGSEVREDLCILGKVDSLLLLSLSVGQDFGSG